MLHVRLWLVLAWTAAPTRRWPVAADTFTVGYLTGSQRRPGDLEYPRPGLTISGAISLAAAEVNEGPLGARGHRLDFLVAETYGEEAASVRQTAQLWMRNVSAYVGPQETCVHEAVLAAAFNLPMISYFCTHHATSDKEKFPTFARTRPPDTQISKSVASVLLTFNWTHVVLLYLKDPDFEFGHIAAITLQTLTLAGVTVTATKYWETPYHHGYMENPFHKLVEETYQDTRIFVILGHHYEHLGLMVAMEEKKLFDKGEYFVLGVDIEQYDGGNPDKYLRGLLQEQTDPLAQRAYRSYLGVVTSSPVGFERFAAVVNSYMERPPFNFPNPLKNFGGGKMIRAEAAYLYDAVHLYAKALLRALERGIDPRNGTAIINFLKGTHYKSAMGYIVYMDENGDAEGNYTLIARQPIPGKQEGAFGLFPVGVFALTRMSSKLPLLYMTGAVNWINGGPPVAVPACGFRGEMCISHTMEITSGVIGGILLVVLIISLVMYRNWRYEQELDSLLWKVDFRDIQIKEDANANQPGTTKTTRIIHPLMRTSQVSLSSNPDADFRYSTIFTQIGIYKGRIFAIKRVHKKSIDITREMKKELKMMRDLRHDNLNAFVGACTESPNICIVTEYCTRGSLKDILENEDVKLDNMFIASLVGDILRGMIYLHESPVRFHGALHSGNCLVDSRWVVKLADFGLRQFTKGSSHPELKEPIKIKETYYKLLYKAPEILRLYSSFLEGDTPCGNQKADSYSFSIILYELHSRHGPFGDCQLSAAEIIHKLISVPGGVPFRPSLESLENSFDFVRECLKECWAEQPEERPDFKTIRTKLRPLRKGMKPNIFDNMMAMMEKYANNLEALVDERTDQLQEEKKKTEALLYEMLPRPVAEQLKKGKKVEAEHFDCVTIYFSDIVGFTAMSAESTPLQEHLHNIRLVRLYFLHLDEQIVDFLNDLYTCFDSIIENYDVYKVETIGDAYMVVGGLPIRNDNQHAAEIATMSLHLLGEVKQFPIRHRPTEKLMLRIGIHSGPVCAGVVGLKMPRYCLFGDTVNTASRMESTGMALNIHVSKECKDLLCLLGGYHLVDRGPVAMKGKGHQNTYWLVGEDAQHRRRRRELRERRRAESRNVKTDTVDKNGHFIVTRSSLKNRNSIVRSPLPRCSSFESPKRLRFASGGHDGRKATDNNNQQLGCPKEKHRAAELAVISDQSPCKKSSCLVAMNSLDCSGGGDGGCRTSSTSCPCIENLAGSAATLAQSQLSMLAGDEKCARLATKPACYSVPSLYPYLAVPHCPVIHTISAPVSPRKQDLVLSRFPECEEVIPWALDSTPLLKITRPQDSETTHV